MNRSGETASLQSAHFLLMNVPLPLYSRRACQILLIIVTVLFTCANSHGDFYVSPLGSDRNDGTESSPFLSLERARDAVRVFNRNVPAFSWRNHVWLRQGDYIRTNAFDLSREDSGTVANPLRWAAYTNETVRLLGGVKLSAFTNVTDAVTSARLNERARPHVVQIDLRSQGLKDFGEMKSRGFARPTSPAHSELFFDGRPMTLARWPNKENCQNCRVSGQRGRRRRPRWKHR